MANKQGRISQKQEWLNLFPENEREQKSIEFGIVKTYDVANGKKVPKYNAAQRKLLDEAGIKQKKRKEKTVTSSIIGKLDELFKTIKKESSLLTVSELLDVTNKVNSINKEIEEARKEAAEKEEELKLKASHKTADKLLSEIIDVIKSIPEEKRELTHIALLKALTE